MSCRERADWEGMRYKQNEWLTKWRTFAFPDGGYLPNLGSFGRESRSQRPAYKKLIREGGGLNQPVVLSIVICLTRSYVQPPQYLAISYE